LSAVLIWGWTFVATKILLAEMGPVEVFALRLAIGLPFLGIVLVATRTPLRFARPDVPIIVLGGAILAAHFIIQGAGLVTTTAINSSWIITVSPLALAVLSVIFLRERLGAGTVLGIAIATAGVLLLVSRGNLTDLEWLRSTGDWLVLISAPTWAIYTVVTRDFVRRSQPLAATFVILAVTTVCVWALLIAMGGVSRIPALSGRGLVALIYLAIPGLAVAHWFWQAGVAALGPTRAGLYLYLEPLATLVLAVPLLGEPFGPMTALGGALVLGGVYLGERRPAISG
jgi:drug/metabolite transporter (DMT)-like permease